MNLTREEARTRAELLEVSSYDVELDLTTGPDTFRSVTRIRFSARTPGATTFVDCVAAAVHEVTLNGRALDPAEVADGVRITLPGLEADNELVVVADARYMNTGEGLHRFVDPVDGEVYLYTQFEVADTRRMFAVFEQPDLKATFAFTVTAPADWTVVSNQPTPLAEVDPARPGTSVWRFAPTPRLACYVTALVAGPYTGFHSELTSADGRTVPLGVFARKSLAEYVDAENIFDCTRRGFAFYEDLFGVPYPFEKYDQLFVPEFNAGAMENAGCVTIVERYVFRSKVPAAVVERRAITILHELAHMWFGDLVTMEWWNDLWLNESFAEFMSHLAASGATQWHDAWTTFSSLEKSWAYRQDQLPSTHPIVADIRDLEDVEVNFDGITYAKGASVLKQLVAYVGRDAFFAGIRNYFAAHAWGNARLADLLGELERTSGRDLAEWSRLWLEESGVTLLRPEIETDPLGTITSFAITQTAPRPGTSLRPHRLAVGVYTSREGDDGRELVRTEHVELDVAGARTEVPELVGRSRGTVVLVNDDDLAYAKTRLDPASLAGALAHFPEFRQSLPRTLVWGAVWDAARDAETPPRDFVDLVLANIGDETESTVIQVLLRQLSTTLRLYLAPEHRDLVVSRAADRLWGLTTAAEPGSDAQLQFVRAFAGFACIPGQLDVVAGLLAGDITVRDLTVDTGLRWDLTIALARAGRLDDAAIDAELARDDTADGRQSAATARAALPSPEAKRRAWSQVVDHDELPNAMTAATISGFTLVTDPALLEEWVEPYFAAVRTAWATRTNEIAQQIVTGLYPTPLANRALLDRTDAWLADELGEGELPALRRLMVENRDGIARALAVQAVDAD